MEEDQSEQLKTQTDANKGSGPPRKTAVGAGEGSGSGGDGTTGPGYGSFDEPIKPKRDLSVLESEAMKIVATKRALERDRIGSIKPSSFGAPSVAALGNAYTWSEPTQEELELTKQLYAVLDEIREWFPEKPEAVYETERRIMADLNNER